uniref:Zgc:92912 n=1 Tax=Cyprinus carpio TaxID=7962 RepID=A0A8C2JMC2_CYPCA
MSAAEDANPAGAPGGAGPPAPPPNTTSNRRLQQTQAQVEEVSKCLCVKSLRTKNMKALYIHRTACVDMLCSFTHTTFQITKIQISAIATQVFSVVLSCLCGCGLQVVDIMRVNVDKVLERDQKLSELDDRADALQAGASQFESCAAKLKNKYWWKNCKMMIIMGVIGVIFIGIIFLYFFS